MTTLYATRGLPGSGKTYYATAWVAELPECRARVNRDDLRSMIDDGRFIPRVTERRIIAVRDAAILALLRKGIDVVCDDTNLKQRVMRDLAALAKQTGAEFEVIDFTDVPLDTCIARDAERDRTVGEQVIRDTHARFLKGRTLPPPLPALDDEAEATPKAYEPNGGPDAVLVDIDGTTALLGDRSPYDETRVHEDLPNRPVVDVVRGLHRAGYRIVYMSGRTEGCRDATVEWLRANVLGEFDGPFMRAAGDQRKDAIVKAELFDAHVRDVYNVACVIDDRASVVRMWRSMGLTVLQCADGDF